MAWGSGWFAGLRAVAFLRRISRELHRANELEQFRLSCEFPVQYQASRFAREPNAPTSPRAKVASISHPTVEAWNQRHRELHPEPLEED